MHGPEPGTLRPTNTKRVHNGPFMGKVRQRGNEDRMESDEPYGGDDHPRIQARYRRSVTKGGAQLATTNEQSESPRRSVARWDEQDAAMLAINYGNVSRRYLLPRRKQAHPANKSAISKSHARGRLKLLPRWRFLRRTKAKHPSPNGECIACIWKLQEESVGNNTSVRCRRKA